MAVRNKPALVLILFAGLFSGIGGGIFFALFHDLPQLNVLKQYRPPAVTRIYSSYNKLLARIFIHQRDPVPLSLIPPYLIQGLLSTEDRAFFDHSGVDLKGILRAIAKDIVAGSYKEGASTITQQLAKTLFLSSEKSIFRKLQEALITFQIERRYTKNEILELYLNQIYLGSGAYGVEAAARTYFDRSARELSLAQSALIAGLPKAPSRYSPLNNPDLALKRRDTVLKQMRDQGFISQAVYETTLQEPVSTLPGAGSLSRAPYFVDFVRPELEKQLGDQALNTQGLTIHTTLDLALQIAAENAVENGLVQLQTRMAAAGNMNPSPEAGLVAIDLATGGILAMVGGRDPRRSRFNRAVHALRQPGSAFKSMIYAAAVEQGLAQNRRVLDAPLAFPGIGNTTDWEPGNYSGTFLGEITARKALALSKNTPAIRLMEELGVQAVADFASRAGISAPLKPNLSLALGTSEIPLLELTSAYGIFPNQGTWIEPFGITRVMDQDNHVIFQSRPEKRAVMSRQGAAVMTDMLKAVILEGTGRKAGSLKGEFGGKTGTTDNFKDALFIGFSPDMVLGVWVGNDDSTSLGKGETGARAALPIWINVVQNASSRTSGFFDIPDGTKMVYMDPDTGKISTEPMDKGVRALVKTQGPD
ncbi:MAG: PBP1A family penicillin-binding protein [Pseudomonadota bacterium]